MECAYLYTDDHMTKCDKAGRCLKPHVRAAQAAASPNPKDAQ